MKQIHRELAELIQSLDSTFGGQVILPEEPLQQRDKGETIAVLQFAVKPNDGIYKDCRVHFEIGFHDGYPNKKPEVNCVDVVAHPNIAFDEDGDDSNVCVSILDDWNDGDCHRDISSLVQAVLFLFYNPEVDDHLVAVGDLEDLKQLVEGTKRGTTPSNEYGTFFPGLSFTAVYEDPELDTAENNKMEKSEKTTHTYLERQPSVRTDADAKERMELNTAVLDENTARSYVAEIREEAGSQVTDEEMFTSPEKARETTPTSAVRERTAVTAVADLSQEAVVARHEAEEGVSTTVDHVTEKMTANLIVVEKKVVESGTVETITTVTVEERQTVTSGELRPEGPEESAVAVTAERETPEITERTGENVIIAFPISENVIRLSSVDDVVGKVNSDLRRTNVTRKVLRKAVYSLWRRIREFITSS